MSDVTNQYEPVFQELMDIIHEQRELINEMAGYIEQLNIGGGGNLIDKTFTENGTFRASSYGADGFRSVTIDVAEGGGGIEPYETNQDYKLYDQIIDPETNTVYVVTEDYKSTDIKTDCENGKLKLVGFDSQIVTFDHPPTQEEVNSLPENCLVVEYNPDDTPYTGILTNNTNN